MIENTKILRPVMLSDTTDPYQPLEKEHRITSRCVEVLAKHRFPLLVVTKSDLVVRDIDLFRQTRTVISMTITTPREEIAEMIEPYATPPESRFKALEKIADEGISAVLRIDPIIPTVNSDKRDLEEIVSRGADFGVKQITASTMKPIGGFFSQLKRKNRELFQRLSRVYADAEWVSGYKYLSRDLRLRILSELRKTVLKYGLEFGTCREGFLGLNTTLCDGTTYCRNVL